MQIDLSTADHRIGILLQMALGIVAVLFAAPVVAAPPAMPQEYRTLAGYLALPLKASPDEFRGEESLAAILAEGHTTLMSLKDLKSSDRQVEYVTRQTEASLTEILQRVERLNALPKPPGTGELVASSFIDGVFGNPAGGYVRGVEAERMQAAIKNEAVPLLAAMEKIDATQQMLATIAQKYAASLTSPGNRLVVDLDEAWGVVGPFDWFHIYNQGPTIRDATLVVKLTGAGGTTRTNVHFVPEWPANTWLYGRYEAGTQALGKAIGQTTVTSIQKIDVTVLSPTLSTSISYAYAGQEKDADIATYCKPLTFHERYQPYVLRKFLPDTKRGVEFTLDGLEAIPKCQVKVTFWGGAHQKSETWEFDYWKRGDKKMFRPKEPLDFDPSMVTMKISFPGTAYTHQHSLLVTP